MESCLKQRLRHCKEDAEEFSGKLVTFFYLATEVKQIYPDVFPCFTKTRIDVTILSLDR
jgi:hypothetical protein